MPSAAPGRWRSGHHAPRRRLPRAPAPAGPPLAGPRLPPASCRGDTWNGTSGPRSAFPPGSGGLRARNRDCLPHLSARGATQRGGRPESGRFLPVVVSRAQEAGGTRRTRRPSPLPADPATPRPRRNLTGPGTARPVPSRAWSGGSRWRMRWPPRAATRPRSRRSRTTCARCRRRAPPAVVFLSGRPFPERDARTTGLGWAVACCGGRRGHGDCGRRRGGAWVPPTTAAPTWARPWATCSPPPATRPPAPRPPSRRPPPRSRPSPPRRAPPAKTAILDDLFRRSTPDVARAIAKILSGELRIGLRGGHLEAAIAEAFERPLADVQWAGMLTGDIGRTARAGPRRRASRPPR